MSIPVEIKVARHQYGGNFPFVGIYTQSLCQGLLITKDDGRHIPWGVMDNCYFRT